MKMLLDNNAILSCDYSNLDEKLPKFKWHLKELSTSMTELWACWKCTLRLIIIRDMISNPWNFSLVAAWGGCRRISDFRVSQYHGISSLVGWRGEGKGLTSFLSQLSLEMVTDLGFPKDQHPGIGSNTGQKWDVWLHGQVLSPAPL